MEEWFYETNAKKAFSLALSKIETMKTDLAEFHQDMLKFLNYKENGYYNHLFIPSQRVNPKIFSINMIKINCNSALSKLTGNTPRSAIITTDEDDVLARNEAHAFDELVYKKLKKMGFYTKIAHEVADDGSTLGTGCSKIIYDQAKKDLVVKRIKPRDVFVPTDGNLDKEVNEIFDRTYLTPSSFKSMFPEANHKIEGDPKGETAQDQDTQRDQINMNPYIEVYSGYYACAEDMEKSRVILFTKNQVLNYGQYLGRSLSHKTFRWENRNSGYWGFGIVQELIATQYKITEVMKDISKGIRNSVSSRVLAHENSQISEANISNANGSIVTWSGIHKPEFQSPPVLPPDSLRIFDKLVDITSQITGLVELDKTKSHVSGKALEATLENETEKFSGVHARYHNYIIDVTKCYLDYLSELVEAGVEFDCKLINKMKPGLRKYKSNKWRFEHYPKSILSKKPAYRERELRMLWQAGAVKTDVYHKLSQSPDIEAFKTREAAYISAIEMIISKAIKAGEAPLASQYIDPQTQIEVATKTYAFYAEKKGEDSKECIIVGEFIDGINELIAATLQKEFEDDLARQEALQQAAMGMAGGGGGTGVPPSTGGAPAGGNELDDNNLPASAGETNV